MSGAAEMYHLGSRAFNPSRHNQNVADDAEYTRLRDLARKAHEKRTECMQRSQEAYRHGDGAQAHQLSEEGKRHEQQMDMYNEQAAQYVFRSNNADFTADEIDLHGLFVEEAERTLEQQILACRQRNESHLHVIVGRGNHSVDHVQKLKPAVERMCREHHFQYQVEPNDGRILITFGPGAPAKYPPPPSSTYSQAYPQQQPSYPQQSYQQQSYQPQAYQQQQYPQQQQQQQQGAGRYDDIERLARKHGPMVLRKLRRMCCEIM